MMQSSVSSRRRKVGDSNRQRWWGAAMLVGALYVAISIASATLANGAPSDSTRFLWRLSAFVGSAVVFGAHIGYEHFRLRRPARPTAWHASLAAALGGFGLALAANIHDLGSAAGYRPRMLIALVAWPILTAVPALVFAWIMAAILDRWRARATPPQ